MICGSLGICSTDLARAKNMFLKLRLSKLPLYRIAKEVNIRGWRGGAFGGKHLGRGGGEHLIIK